MAFRLRRPNPSLIARLTVGYMLAHAVTMTLFFTILYPFAVGNGEEHAGPKLALSYLENDIVPQGRGLALRPDADILALAESNPRLWLVVEGRNGRLNFGPVPRNVPNRLVADRIVESADLRNLGARGWLGEASFESFQTAAGPVIAGVGGLDPQTVSMGAWMAHYYRDIFWIHLFTTIFTLAGAAVAIPITLASVRPTARAASLIGPDRMDNRIPEQRVVRELLPIVRAFNRAVDRLDEAFERRRRFIADVAHELRTPLAVLNMKVEALPQSETKAGMERTVYRLGEMVGQMLDAERLAMTGRRRERLNLVALAKAAVADVAPLAVSSGYEIVFEAPDEEVFAQGDAHAIGRAVSNLLGNAVAHGGQSGTITVRVGAGGAIDVADQGQGIPAEARDRIFEPFHRERWDRDGCGLGLYLVRQIMRAHGGDAYVLPAELGTVFRLDFPSAGPVTGARRPTSLQEEPDPPL